MALGRSLRLLDEMTAAGRTAFTAVEVRERLGVSPQAASNLLHRLARDGLVERVMGGRYAIRPLGALGTAAGWDDVGSAVAAAFAGQAHRIGFLTALDHHGLLVRPVRSLQIASEYRPRAETVSGRPLTVVREHAETLLLGTEPLGPSRISTVERALLDTASRSRLTGGASRLAEALAAAPSDAALDELARRLRAWPAYRRIGSISAALTLPVGAALEPPPWRSLIQLDPTARRSGGWTDRAWGVAWPYPAAELAEVTAQ